MSDTIKIKRNKIKQTQTRNHTQNMLDPVISTTGDWFFSFLFSHKHDGFTELIESQSGFSLSYPKLQQLVKSMASGLHKHGISKVVVVSVDFESLRVPEYSFFYQLLLSDSSLLLIRMILQRFFIRLLSAIPMFHVYGLSLFVMGLFTLGCSIVVMRKFDVNEMVRAIDCYRVTHLPVVPPILMAMTRVKAPGGCDLGSLKQVSCGAAPLSRKTIQEFLQAFPYVDFFQGYGMTESTAVGTRGFNTEYFRKYTSVDYWLQIRKLKLCIGTLAHVCPQAKVVNYGYVDLVNHGCILLALFPGYLNDADATKSTVNEEGWLHTGDIAYFDQDSTCIYWIIAPADLEAVLISHSDILDVAVTVKIIIKTYVRCGSKFNEEIGEVPLAFVVNRLGSELSEDDVINFVAAQSFPRSPAGKVLRRLVKVSSEISMSSKL
ncbi:hypothetical protein MKX01_038601 [Papaver californicum]|nr:hypothetical protein MKX01_038601 [Papaver californicum]